MANTECKEVKRALNSFDGLFSIAYHIAEIRIETIYFCFIFCFMWGSDNICIRKKKKFGGKKLVEAPVCGALAFLGVEFMQKWKMVGIGGKWSKIGFYFA
ncbi:hypothetical protein [Pasteurella multocida]|uniref:hypothetical protein n=1 Tax=Pasteurella multocida TaxID=747 RepID=UPI00111A1D1C|nr:hypothetical protein [Pasteurella multocida]MDY0631731.1 hypothetical protein [Pasteurella multocida]QDA11716.1 hypothetical protein E0L18_01720 [Pasteurella multocida subsp. multocida]